MAGEEDVECELNLHWPASPGADIVARRSRLFASLRNDDVYPQIEWIELRRPGDAERYLRNLELRSA